MSFMTGESSFGFGCMTIVLTEQCVIYCCQNSMFV